MERRKSVQSLKDLAYRANQWSSFNPDRAGEVLLDGCESELSEFLSQIPEEFHEEYEKKFLDLYRHWLVAQSRCASPAVTGPAKFPVARNNKYLAWERSAREKLNGWVERVIKRLNKKERLTGWDEIERLQNKIEELTELQETMKAANKILRKKDLDDDEKMKELVNLGMSEQMAKKVQEPDYMGRVGFPSFSLTNNLATIKNAQARMNRLISIAQAETKEYEFEWGKMVLDTDDERLRLVFNEIPSEELRSELKGHAFKWSRMNQAWQRQLTRAAIYSACRIMGIKEEISWKG